MTGRQRVPSVIALCLAVGSMFAYDLVRAASAPGNWTVDEKESRLGGLEARLAELDAEKRALRKNAVAAMKRMPLFTYRPGAGLSIRAADGSWEVQFVNQFQVYWSFWTKGGDGTSRPKRGTVNGVLQIRRFRPGMNLRLADGFYELNFKMDVGGDSNTTGFTQVFYANLGLHFEKLNPWFPTLNYGPLTQILYNPQDGNCSSHRCGRSEQSMLDQGSGLGDLRGARATGLIWKKMPHIGPVKVEFLNLWYSLERVSNAAAFAGLESAGITRDGRAFTAGISIKPFDKTGGTFGKVFKSLNLSFGAMVQDSPRSGPGFQAWNIRTNQTRAQRVSMIKTDSSGTAGYFYNYSPGLGWRWKWITLRLAGMFATANLCDVDANGRCNKGGLFRGSSWRFMGEFWLWSPRKGMLSGSPREGGLMLSPLFQRVDVQQSGQRPLADCGGCKKAHAVNAGIALWYYFPNVSFNVGLIWDHWACVSCNEDVIRVVPGFIPGDSASFDTLTLVSRFAF